jgi:hypothetical protein
MSETNYTEAIDSPRTTVLFIGLTLVFGLLFVWQIRTAGLGGWAITWLCFGLFFLFYSLNYRVLQIRLDTRQLVLRFGIFRWQVPVSNIEACYQDPTSLWRIGGAGIHFSPFDKRYRAIFNFLQYPRVVVMLKQKKGPVQDIAFTTQAPEIVMELLREAIAQS